jgi:UDP-glucose:(heptosyl)LPS alpha-1,3-glucosyltransferase
LFGRHGFSNVGRNRAWLKQLATALPQRELDGVIGFNKLPGIDVYYGSDPCYLAKSRRLKSAWFRLLPRYHHFAALEESVFRQGQRTQILLLTPHEIPLYRQFYQTEADRFHVLPPGIQRLEFSEVRREATRQQIRDTHGWPRNERLLLLVGSGFRVKGLDRAIAALASLPTEWKGQSRLVVIGQNRSNEFALQAGRLGVGDRVTFLGGRDDVPDWLLAADVLVHPAYSESAGMILLEAMTAGVPVLTTDTCGYAAHVERAGAGIVLPSPFRQADCNRALAAMLLSDQVPTWRANGVAYADREDLYSCHESAVEIIEATVRKKSGAPADLTTKPKTGRCS